MITIIILSVIYLSFISLGLPDSVLGVSIPAMQAEWGFPLSYGGAVSMIIVGSTIISSFSSSFIIKRIGTGKVTFASCLLTAASLYGFSVSPSYIWPAVLAVPLGLGGGSVDTALNNYVALHFKARHMNWLHSFWGVGATLGPVLMSFFIASSGSWRSGYCTISLIQILLASVLFAALPLWKRHMKMTGFNETAEYRKEREERKNVKSAGTVKSEGTEDSSRRKITGTEDSGEDSGWKTTGTEDSSGWKTTGKEDSSGWKTTGTEDSSGWETTGTEDPRTSETVTAGRSFKKGRTSEKSGKNKNKRIIKIKGVKYALLTFLFYCAVEHSVGLWGSSYLVRVKNAALEEGAFWMAFYYGGITAGRFLAGFFSFYFSNPQMIRYGLLTAFTGSLLLFFPLPAFFTGCSFVLIGVGLSPVFPAMLHETPLRFGKEKSQDIIGFQMGFGYTGSAFLPLVLGIILQNAGMVFFPFFITSLIFLVIIVSGRIDKASEKAA